MSPTTYVALLRGINVGGHRKVPMSRLREIATALGLDDVRTYIASGNLIFSSTREPAALNRLLGDAILAEFGFAVDLIVVDLATMRAALDGVPFADGDPKQVVVTFLSAPVPAADREVLRGLVENGERIDFGPNDGSWLYVDYAGGLARSRLGARLHAASPGRVATTRNLSTVRRLTGLMTPEP